jgi:fumarylacetoacetase
LALGVVLELAEFLWATARFGDLRGPLDRGFTLASGDLFGSGTPSGPRPEQAGSLLELSQGGKQAISLPNGEVRSFLEDGDSVTFFGSCTRAGFRRIGFGRCEATVEPS